MNIIINEMEGTEKQNAYAADIIRREFGCDLSDKFVTMKLMSDFCMLNELKGMRVSPKLYRPFYRELTAEKLAAMADEYTRTATCREVIDNKGANVARAAMAILLANA